MAKKKAGGVTAKLTDAEQDTLTHLQQGYQLETDSLGANPVLRAPKDDEFLRPANANASTVKGLQKRGLIAPGKGRDLLTIAWHLKK
jgi:cytosine/adenosine deaminase-related metal-dependent hydrolase